MTMDSESNCESPGYNVNVPLSGAAIETLHCLFIHGPTYDGNVPSKSGRDELHHLKLIERCDGYQYLTRAGVRLALVNKLDREKDSRSRRVRAQLAKLEQIEAILIPAMTHGGAEGLTTSASFRPIYGGGAAEKLKPTILGLEELLKPEREDGRV